MTHVSYEIDGRLIHSLNDFTSLAGEAVGGPGTYFGSSNLDAFADCLSGGFGTPNDRDFSFRIVNAEAARNALGYDATLGWLRWNLPAVHPTSKERWEASIRDASAGVGDTLFDKIVTIFESMGVTLALD